MSLQSTSYDLEERTYQFALSVRQLVAGNKWQRQHYTDIDQVLRSSGSIGANYIEANDAVSDKDFIFRIKISKKEAKESRILATILKNRQSR